jgi:hypothetical protein
MIKDIKLSTKLIFKSLVADEEAPNLDLIIEEPKTIRNENIIKSYKKQDRRKKGAQNLF